MSFSVNLSCICLSKVSKEGIEPPKSKTLVLQTSAAYQQLPLTLKVGTTGIEPISHVYQTCILTVELRAHTILSFLMYSVRNMYPYLWLHSKVEQP